MSTDSTSWTVDTSGVTSDSDSFRADGSSYILFPDVPPFPGVPPLLRPPPGVQQIVDVLTGAASPSLNFSLLTGTLSFSLFSPGPLPQYAILYPSVSSPTGQALQSLAALTPDSVVEVDVSADSEVMTHPIEEGQFEAYNRVQDPIRIRMLLGCQGQNVGRSTFLSTLEGLREGTDLVTIAMPDATYENMALADFGYRKSAERGAVTIWADTTWIEGRSTGVTVSSPGTSQPQGAAPLSVGALQPLTLSPAQIAAVDAPPVVPSPLPVAVASEMPPSGDAF